ncbi:MAG: hypothetical protein KJ710_02535, partial [Candidatus Omnitrophica bacterium]|nr:hypothetical protein [Candidatus Omnitrophota bacterium]
KWGKRFVTKIVSNPPHGWGFSEISGMNEEACYQLFIKHVRKIYELELLTIDGEAYYAIPYVWVDRLFKENLPCEILVLENQVEGKRLSIVCLKQKSSSLFSTVKSPKRIAPLSYHLKRLLGFLSISRSL